jgi:hypothetical protein
MSTAPSVAVVHYPEGAGHATRMLAIADALEEAGADVSFGGGGAGTEFVALNGYDAVEPTTVDFIDTYQDGSLWQSVRHSVPASLGRIADCRAWLASTEPDAVVTDDMFAAMAASRCDVPLYVLKHDMPGLYHNPLERGGARFHTLFQLSAASEFFYPVVWPESDIDPDRATRIPPVALDGEPAVRDDADVVVVPSHYSSLDRVADHLRRQGYDVVNVADDDWEAVPSLLPYIRGADCVVCSGYSTMMDAAVAGTPCVVHPATDEQDAVAEWIRRFDVTGFTVAPEPIDVLDAVATPPDEPEFRNGAAVIARRVLADVRDPDPYATPDSDTDDGPAVISRAAWGHSLRAVPTLLAVGLLTVGSVVRPSRVGAGVRSKARQTGEAAREGLSRGIRGVARAVSSGKRHLRNGARRLRGAARRLGRGAAAPF